MARSALCLTGSLVMEWLAERRTPTIARMIARPQTARLADVWFTPCAHTSSSRSCHSTSQISPPGPLAHPPDSWEAARTQVLLHRAPLLSALHKQSPHLRRHRPCPREKPSAHSQDHVLGEHWVALCHPPASTHVPPEPEALRESQYLADPREGFARRPS